MDEYDWLDDEATEKTEKEITEARIRRATAYHNTFGEGDGRKILEEWIQRFCTGAVPGAGASVRECAMRDGKQEMVKEILDQLTLATTPRG